MSAPLTEGDVIEICVGHKINADVPKHFVYSNRKGRFDLVRECVAVGGELAYLAGKYVVTSTCLDGGGGGENDRFPNGHHVFCRRLDDPTREIDFYQSGSFAAMIRHIEPIGQAELQWVWRDQGDEGIRKSTSFGWVLKRARTEARRTLQESANYFGMSIGNLCDMEYERRRPPRMDVLERMEEFYEIKDGSLIKAAKQSWKIPDHAVSFIMRQPKASLSLLRGAEGLPEDQLAALSNMTQDEVTEMIGEWTARGRRNVGA